MIELLITLGSIIGYLAVGFGAMRVSLPNLWVRSRAYAESISDYSVQSITRGDVKMWSWLIVLLWPFMLPILGMSRMINGQIAQTDPKHLAEKAEEQKWMIAEQQATIMRLERELGIGK